MNKKQEGASSSKSIVRMGIYSNNFSYVFSALLGKSQISCYKISEYTHLDQGYLSRLSSGEKKNPSSETIMKISLAICHFNQNIKLSDIEKLFNAVGRTIISPKDECGF
jgi:hypothetical protein